MPIRGLGCEVNCVQTSWCSFCKRQVGRLQGRLILRGLSSQSSVEVRSYAGQSQANPKDWNEGEEPRSVRHASCRCAECRGALGDVDTASVLGSSENLERKGARGGTVFFDLAVSVQETLGNFTARRLPGLVDGSGDRLLAPSNGLARIEHVTPGGKT
jgi:hypothetical protein